MKLTKEIKERVKEYFYNKTPEELYEMAMNSGMEDAVEDNAYKKYRRKEVFEIRPVTQEEIDGLFPFEVEEGDMIAKNPNKKGGIILIHKSVFKDKYEPFDE